MRSKSRTADARPLASRSVGIGTDAALDGRVELVASPILLAEIGSVLMRPRLRRCLSLDEAARFVADLGSQMTLVSDAPAPYPAVCRDVNDDCLVALAVKDAC